MATKSSELIARIQEVLRDDKTGSVGVVYKTAEALEWINDAQRSVCLVRPDAKSVITSFVLVTGTKQAIPSTGRRLMGLVRNMGSDGITPGKAIRGPVPQEDLDSYDPDWHTKTGEEVRQYVYTEENETIFYVSPGAASAFYVEARLALFPVNVTTTTDNIDLTDIYIPAMLEWMLYRFFSRDDERTPNYVRAGRHFGNFFNLLGVKRQADMAISPKILEYK